MDGLLAAVHRGPLEDPGWWTFSERLRSLLKATSVSFSFRLDANHGPGVLTVARDPAMPHASEVKTGGVHRVGPPPAGDMLEPRRLHDVRDFLDPGIAEHARFEHEIMRRHGLRFMRVACIPEASGVVAWLAVGRESRDFSAEEAALIAALIPHLEISLGTFVALDRERSRSIASGDVVRRLNFCWIRLDANAQILDLDAQADQILRQSPAVTRSARGRLTLSDRAADRALGDALKALAGQPNGRARAFHLADDPWLDILLVRPRDAALIDMMEPSIIAYIHGEVGPAGDRREQLSDLFGLTEKEARLALAISRGRSIREAAGELGLTEQSAREYTKRIYAKTGTRGQADLVRLILTSVVALA